MNKKTIKGLKEKLDQEKKSLEEELERFAQKDKKIKGDWDTRFPSFGKAAVGSQRMEDAADEVEEYANLLPVEYNLETRLKNVNSALEKIKRGTYGKCEKCGKEIGRGRLEIYPAARRCEKCAGQK